MKWWYAALSAIVIAVLLVGCGGAGDTSGSAQEEAAPAEEGVASEAETDGYASVVLVTDYEDALPASSQLALGSLLLAETEEAITGEQANSLLPLWQALQGGVTASAEVNAVLKQIEKSMGSEQLEAIAELALTQDDMAEWMREQGAAFGPGAGPGDQGDVSEEERATRRAEFAEGGGFGGGQGGQGGEVSPEMATRRAQFENMGDEEREALRATMQTGGGPGGVGEAGGPAGGGPRGGGGFSARQYMVVLQPLVEMLSELAES